MGHLIGDASPERRNAVDALEAMVDGVGLAAVLDMLAEICSGKADHVRVAWQDGALATAWDQAAGRLLTASVKVKV